MGPMNQKTPLLRLVLPSLLVLVTACSGGKTEPEPAQADGAAVVADEPAADAADRFKVKKVVPLPTDPTGLPKMLAAHHILVAWQGAERAAPEITRSKDEALERAKALIARLEAGEDFEAVARAESDGSDKAKGGDLGEFRPFRVPRAMADGVHALEIGEVGKEPVESPLGYHVLRRDKAEYYGAKHILVQWQGAERADAEKVTRSKDEARARAEELLAKVKAGEDFEVLAMENSDGPTAPRGGHLDVFPKGAMVPPFEAALDEVAPNTLVPHLVETPFGFHIIHRTN